MATTDGLWNTLTAPLIRQNPVTLQILGICSALAVTTSLDTALTMAVALTVVIVSAGRTFQTPSGSSCRSSSWRRW
jgi:Na+-transporting NADH:ubiquinone oxidoreductase subunit D